MPKHLLSSLLLVVLSFFPNLGFGQNPTGGPPAGVGGAPDGVGGTQSTFVAPDTSKLVYFLSDRPQLAYSTKKIDLDRDFYIVDPARKGAVDYATIGNLGSSARPLLFQPTWRRGFKIGNNPFDVYSLKADQLKYYWSDGAYTNMQYALGRGQSEGRFAGQYGRTFADSINFSLDYSGINHSGQFLFQRVKHNSLSMGLWIPKKNRWQGFVNFTQNVFRQQENGGLPDSITQFSPTTLGGPIGLPINMADRTGLSRLADWALEGKQYYDLVGKKGGRKLVAVHTIRWGKERYHFQDRGGEARADSIFLGESFYPTFQGVRNYWRTSRVENELMLRTFKLRSDGGSDQLNVGIEHGFWEVQHGGANRRFNQLFLKGDVGFQLKEALTLQARGAFGLSTENIGQYNVEGKLVWSLGKGGAFEVGLLNQKVPTFGIHDTLYLSTKEVWGAGLPDIIETSLHASYSLPSIGLTVKAQNHLVNNYTYFNELAFPTQIASLNVTQLIVQEKIRLRSFGTEHVLALQRADNEMAVNLPLWYYRGSAFVETPLFKKNLLMRVGTEFRANAAFEGDAYMPVSWQFYTQNTNTLPTYAWLDIYLGFKIKDFRFLVRYENIGDLSWTNDLYFLTKNNPMAPQQLRFSLAWRFRDR